MTCKRLFQALYIICCIGVVWHTWFLWTAHLPEQNHEIFLFSVYQLMVLAFPIYFVYMVFCIEVMQIFPTANLFSDRPFLSWLLLFWAPTSAAGYWQWFVLVPRLFNWYRNWYSSWSGTR